MGDHANLVPDGQRVTDDIERDTAHVGRSTSLAAKTVMRRRHALEPVTPGPLETATTGGWCHEEQITGVELADFLAVNGER